MADGAWLYRPTKWERDVASVFWTMETVARLSLRRGSRPIRAQICGVIHANDKDLPRYSDQAFVIGDVTRNVVSKIHHEAEKRNNEESTYTHLCVGSAPVKNGAWRRI